MTSARHPRSPRVCASADVKSDFICPATFTTTIISRLRSAANHVTCSRSGCECFLTFIQLQGDWIRTSSERRCGAVLQPPPKMKLLHSRCCTEASARCSAFSLWFLAWTFPDPREEEREGGGGVQTRFGSWLSGLSSYLPALVMIISVPTS